MNAAMQAAVGAFWLDAVRSAGEIGKKDIQRVHDKQFSAGLLGKLRPKQLHDCALDALRRDHCVSELASIEYFLWQGQDAAEPQLRKTLLELTATLDYTGQYAQLTNAFHDDVLALNRVVTGSQLLNLCKRFMSQTASEMFVDYVFDQLAKARPAEHLRHVRAHESSLHKLFYPLRAGLVSTPVTSSGFGTPLPFPPPPPSPPAFASAPAPASAFASAPASAPALRPLMSRMIDTLAEDVTTYLNLHRVDDAGETTAAPVESAPSLDAHFFGRRGQRQMLPGASGVVIADGNRSNLFPEATLLGRLTEEDTEESSTRLSAAARNCFLNTHEPFAMVCVGVQGGGKSHTLASVVEGCLIPFPEHDLVKLSSPMSALVLHFDRSSNSMCEATGLTHPSAALRRLLGDDAARRCVPRKKLVVLVSSSFYEQRKRFYAGYCEVKPLLFHWTRITADAIRRIMRVSDDDTQLYMASLLDLLRQYQRKCKMPAFNDFVQEVKTLCNAKGQSSPLDQRLSLLSSLIAEADVNKDLAAHGLDVREACQPGTLCVVDLTDPMLSSSEANGIFTVLVDQFRALPNTRAGKLLALDEAHKYMSGAPTTDGLAASLVNGARLMRHDGMRLVISTQSPLCLAPELLELTSVAIMHRFHSRDWFTYMKSKLPLAEMHWPRILSLEPGEALVFATRHLVNDALSCAVRHRSDVAEEAEGEPVSRAPSHVFAVTVRPRITADRGASKTNTQDARSG